MRRIDQWLSNLGYCSRREAREWIRDGRVRRTSGEPCDDAGEKVAASAILIDGEPPDHPEGLLLLMNKPAGYVCSHDAREGKRVYDLLPERWNRRLPAVTSIGRLDRDTTGLLLLTDQTPLVHRLTSPKHKVPKRYQAHVTQPVPLPRQEELTQLFASGTLTLDGEACLPAELRWPGPADAELVLTEGRFHQVRRMFAAVSLTVAALHRSDFGLLTLPQDLALGAYRQLPLDFSFF